MANKLGTFDFRKVAVVLGIHQITGYADGDVVEISLKNPSFKDEGGADGQTDRVKNANNALMIKIKLRQSSPSNDILTQLHLADLAAGAVLPFALKDTEGKDLFAAAAAWIVKFPDYKAGNNVVEREWEITTGSDYAIYLGGA